jgi:hypothetical protein
MKTLCLYLLSFLSFSSFAQTSDIENSLQIPREKVYLNLHKSHYFAGEKITLDIVVADAQTLQNDTLSIPLYLELIDNQKDTLLQRWILKIIDGKVNTSIQMPDELQTDYYQIRAYTNWMRNFSPEAIPRMNLLILGQNYKENIPTEILKPAQSQINVYPESGICVNGLVNNLLVRTTDNFGKGMKSIIALKSDTTTIRIFDTDENGDALVQFEPMSGKSYYLESGYLKTDLPKTQEAGVIMRGYYVNDGRKLNITIQNNLPILEPLKMVLQTRGNNFYSTLIEPKKITFFNLKTDSIPEGILNVALIDLEGKVVCERSFLNVLQDKNQKDNYLLFNSEIDTPIEFTDKFFTNIQKINAEMISRRNVVFGFNELQKKATTQHIITHKNELGLSLNGKITDRDTPENKNLINVSLIIKPNDNDTVNQKQLFAVLPNEKGNFAFENLDFYGKVGFDLKASWGNKTYDLSILSDSIPPIIRMVKPIDWRAFQDTTKQQSLVQEYKNIEETRANEERMKTKELAEVVVKASKIKRSPQSIFLGEPSVRFPGEKVLTYGGHNAFFNFYKARVEYRIRKYQPRVHEVRVYVNDTEVQMSSMLMYSGNEFAYVDIYEGTPECDLVKSIIVINIYTKDYSFNPVVEEMMAKNESRKNLKKQRVGYYASN